MDLSYPNSRALGPAPHSTPAALLQAESATHPSPPALSRPETIPTPPPPTLALLAHTLPGSTFIFVNSWHHKTRKKAA
eukprot:1501800-Rhodomonas_salina.2